MPSRHASIPAQLAAVTLAAAVLASCSTKPPPSPVDMRHEALGDMSLDQPWHATRSNPGAIRDDWLSTFHDDQLAALVAEAMAHNPDLRISAARIEQAAGALAIAKAPLYPTVSILGKGSTKMGDSLDSGISGALLAVAWELDVWGRIRYGRNAAQEDLVSVRADSEFARQSIAAGIAKTWFLAAESVQRLRVTSEMLDQANHLVALAQKRLDLGYGSEEDLVTARAAAGTFQDALAQSQRTHDESVRALELLLGRYPAGELAAASELPDIAAPVPAGLPFEMLERRPDVIASERRVAAAFDRTGEAKAARLPRLRLTASAGAISSETLQFKSDFSNPIAGVGADLVAPIYAGGALQAGVTIRTAEQKAAVAGYAQVVLRALGEVENGLGAEQSLAARRGVLQQVVADNERSLTLTETSYKVGQTDMRDVLQQQMAVSNARLALLRVRTDQLVERVNIHLALGGSFDTQRLTDAAPPSSPDAKPTN